MIYCNTRLKYKKNIQMYNIKERKTKGEYITNGKTNGNSKMIIIPEERQILS